MLTGTGGTEREAILAAIAAWIAQRPGLEPRNYISHGADDAGRRAYRAEVRSIGQDLRDARELLRAVTWRESIATEALKQAFNAYSGRLSVTTWPAQYGADACPGRPCSADCDHRGAPWTAALDYCTGQYWPTEYRRAACAVLASALWDAYRAGMPETPTIDGESNLSPGDRIRRHFRREFGRSMQQRWFN